MLTFPEKAYSNPHIPAPTKRESLIMKGLILLGLIFLAIFILWFFKSEFIGFKPLYYLLTAALIFRIIKMVHEWYHYWGISAPDIPERTREWTVDMLTTFVPGEPYEMTVNTLKAMVAVTYPHTTYLCDEGDDPYLKKVCEELGVVHVTREIKVDAKAGNINNALRQATGEITIILDPDHIPAPNFIDRVLPYFEDEQIGYVQCVQAYYNQNDSLIAKAAAEQTYHFYGPMMMSMNQYGTAQAIGANCAFRRAALDSIGGHAAGLSEDMHTAMKLHSNGWESVYVPEALSRGLAPATLSAFYKQQLKWSRGTFELLFVSFPRLVKGFSIRQIIHYVTLPLYFLYGLIGLIDIGVPIASMLLSEVPWKMELGQLLLFGGPTIFMSIVIRQYSQRWLLEESERGFHLLGGILLAGTWWVFLTGFIYTIFRIKVPYIPTPKEGESENAFKLSLPNITVIIISIFAIIYGISVDYTPYSMMMATFAGVNIMTLGALVIISQQKFVRDFRYKYNLKKPTDRLRGIWWNFRHAVIYPMFRQRAGLLVMAFMLITGWYVIDSALYEPEYAGLKDAKDVKGFYVGVDLGESSAQFVSMQDSAPIIPEGKQFQLISIDHYDAIQHPELLEAIISQGATPMLAWTQLPKDDLAKTLQATLSGEYDLFLDEFSALLNRLEVPVFITVDLDHQENLENQNLFIKTWEYIHQKLDKSTHTKIAWIWKISPATLESQQPYHQYIDWYNLDVSAFTSSDDLTHYLSKTDSMMEHSTLFPVRPIILSGIQDDIFSTFSNQGDMSRNLISTQPRIRGWLLQSSQLQPFSDHVMASIEPDFTNGLETGYLESSEIAQSLESSEMTERQFQLDFIRGVNYNLESDWRDGHAPLTRRQLEADFEAIRAMGANTIRRYAPSMYDRNVLSIAREYELDVLYGFDFDAATDFRTDRDKARTYLSTVREKVATHQFEPSVVAWVLGDDTWNDLSNHFSEPYLSVVREGYVDFLNDVAREIHQIDSTRPVIAPFTLDREFRAAYSSLSHATEVDVIGINIFDDEFVSPWYQMVEQDPVIKPWMVTAFGPQSHANRTTTQMTASQQPIEPTSRIKSAQYVDKWERFIENPPKQFMGGLAFCWRDRMDGSLTWYGLTDVYGRKKTSYWSLANQWTSLDNHPNLQTISILSPGEHLEPGGWHEFRAISPTNHLEGTEISWVLMPEGQLREVGNVSLSNDGQIGKIGFPTRPGLYRLYVYQSDNEGNVITASLPIQLGNSEDAPEELWWETLVNLIR